MTPGVFVGLMRSIGVSAAALLGVVLVVLIVASLSADSRIGQWTFANYADLFALPDLTPVLKRTLAVGIGTTIVLMGLALPMSWILARTKFSGRALLLFLFAATLTIPAFVTAMSYVWLFNPNSGIVNQALERLTGRPGLFDVYSIAWICLIQGLKLTPPAVFMMLPAFMNLDAALEEAAAVSGVSPPRAFFGVVLPVLAPAVGATAIFFFILAIEIFDVVAVIGMPADIDVLTVLSYQAIHTVYGPPDYGFASAVGMPLVLLSGLGVLIYLRLLRRADRFALMGGKTRRVEAKDLGGWALLAWLIVVVWGLLTVVIPLFTVIWTSLTPFLMPPSPAALRELSFASYAGASALILKPLINTLLLIAAVLCLAIVWSVCLSWLTTRIGAASDRAMDAVIFLSMAVPGMLLAIAMQFLSLSAYGWLPLYGTIWLIVVTMAARALAFATRTINSAALQIDRSLEEAAYVCGIGPVRTFFGVFVPLVRPAIGVAALVIALVVSRDLAIPLVLYTPDAPVLATAIYDLQSVGRYGEAAVLSLIVVGLLVLCAAGARAVAVKNRKHEEEMT